MIKFYNHAADDGSSVLYFSDNSYVASMYFSVDRPATDEDKANYPEEFAALTASTPPVAPAA